jgi:hypothetical protein
MPNYGDKIYQMLPKLYRIMDANIKPTSYPLQRFSKILGTGLDFLDEKIEGHYNLSDLDKCPKELLEYMAYFLGVNFLLQWMKPRKESS